jgi:FkbM family methyltransferase
MGELKAFPIKLFKGVKSRFQRLSSIARERRQVFVAAMIVRSFARFRRSFPQAWNHLVANVIESDLQLPVLFADEFGSRFLVYPSDGVMEMLLREGSPIDCLKSLRFIQRNLGPGAIAVDVGANIGAHTLLCARQVSSQGRVFSLEPESRNFARLLENLSINQVECVTAIRSAVCSAEGTVQLHVFGAEAYGQHSLGIPQGLPPRDFIKSSVAAVTLDGLASQYGLDRIDLLKVDVEGAELEVFKGAKKLFLEKRIGCLVFEVSVPMLKGMGVETSMLFDFLHQHDYKTYQILDDGSIGAEIQNSSAIYDNYAALPLGGSLHKIPR